MRKTARIVSYLVCAFLTVYAFALAVVGQNLVEVWEVGPEVMPPIHTFLMHYFWFIEVGAVFLCGVIAMEQRLLAFVCWLAFQFLTFGLLCGLVVLEIGHRSETVYINGEPVNRPKKP